MLIDMSTGSINVTVGDIWLVKVPGATTLGKRKILELVEGAVRLGTVDEGALSIVLPVVESVWYKTLDVDFVACYTPSNFTNSGE